MGAVLHSGYLILALRVLLLAASFPLMKALNRNQSSIAATALFVLVGGACILPLASLQIASDLTALARIGEWIDNSLLSATVFASGMIFFMWALGRGEISLLAPLTSLTLVFIYIFDLVAGNVSLSWQAPAGILLVMAGITLLNLTPGTHLAQALNPLGILYQPGALGAVYFALAIATTRVIDSRVASFAPPLLYAANSNLVVGAVCIVLLLVRRRVDCLARLWNERLWIAVGAGVVGILSYVVLLVCYDYFAPSLIEPVSQLGVVAATLLGAWLYREPLYWRWLAAIFVGGGAALVMLAR